MGGIPFVNVSGTLIITSHFAQIEICILWYKAEERIYGSLFQAFIYHEYVLVLRKDWEFVNYKHSLMFLMCFRFSYHASLNILTNLSHKVYSPWINKVSVFKTFMSVFL